MRGTPNKPPLTYAGRYASRDEHACSIEPARALAAEALTLERRAIAKG
ncbi:MAG TPA: hypothetical protein VMU04_03430 [Candidatus Acidoferrum sp.]|nr:hypothetical protein [Candidatus Acidoferrum sp.]